MDNDGSAGGPELPRITQLCWHSVRSHFVSSSINGPETVINAAGGEVYCGQGVARAIRRA